MDKQVQRTERKANKRKKRRSNWPVKRKRIVPVTAEEFFAMPEHKQNIHTLVPQAVTYMRTERVSTSAAASKYGLDRRTLVRWGRQALRKGKNGRYTAKPSDTLLRVLPILKDGGKQEIAIRDSRQASLIGEHWNAADLYITTGDASILQKFRGVVITDIDGNKHELLTDLAELDRLGNAGVLSFESIYARTT